MIIPDVNLLVYSLNTTGPEHVKAAAWWERCLNGNEAVALPWVTVNGFLRIASSPRIFDRPWGIPALLDLLDEWFARPHVRVIEPKPTHLQAMRSIAQPLGLAGDIMNDVHLAALALEYGAVVHTSDRDFAKFRGVRWLNPLD